MFIDPQIIVLGAHKCGTSWLFNCLYEHEEIFIKDKIDYFYVDSKKELGLPWYQNHFNQHKTSEKVKIDLSTVYFFSEKTAEDIYKHNPNTKLIVLLRNPIERAYSHFLQEIKMGQFSKETSFEAALKLNPNLLKWGNYKKHLETFFKWFPKDQIHVILHDDIKNNPLQVINNVYAFANVNPHFIPNSLTKTINPSRIPKNTFLDLLKRKLSNNLRKNMVGEKIWWKLKHSWLVKKYYAFNSTKSHNFKGINKTTREKLFLYFKEDILYIQQYLQRNDINWN